MNTEPKKLFGTLFKVGCIGFGGGSALIPVLHRNIVEESHLVSEEDFNKDVAVAISTPGALPVEISVGVGSRVAGLPGFFIAPVMMSLPGTLLSLIIIILLGQMGGGLSRQFSFVSMGITAYIMSVIIMYIYNTFSEVFHGIRPQTASPRTAVLPDIRLLLKSITVTLAVILLFAAVVFLVSPQCSSFSWKACLSSILSFGGGDAYMAVAERLFVATGLLASYSFYSIIFPVVNATPGSILCKTLTCIGYCIGVGISGNIAMGLILALCGYVFSICMSCITYAAGSCFLEALTVLKVWKYISLSLRVIISVLQLNILRKLAEGFVNKGAAFDCANWACACILALLVVFNIVAPKVFHIKKAYAVLASVAVCVIVGNVWSWMVTPSL